MRRIWRDLGPLLDVIFCNCEGYLDLTATLPRVRRLGPVGAGRHQFFYNASSLTVSDLHYLRRQGRERTCMGWARSGRTALRN